MPIIKNRMFQPVGVMLSDGGMLYLGSREEREVLASDLDAPHLRSLVASGQLALQDGAALPRATILKPTRRAPSGSEPAPAAQ